MSRPSNDSHVSGKNNLYIGVHYVFVEWRIVCHIEQDCGQLWYSITSPVAEVAAAISLDQQSNSLENFMQDFFHRVVALDLFYELKYELSLLDGGDILVRGWVFDLDLVVEGSSDHICLKFLFIILLGKLWVVVKELLYGVLVCHVVQVWMNDPSCHCTKML